MTSTNSSAEDFAIVAGDSIIINGWRSEDSKLIFLPALYPGGPITLENISQRQHRPPPCNNKTVIDIRTVRRAVSVRDATLMGDIDVSRAATTRLSIENVVFECAWCGTDCHKLTPGEFDCGPCCCQPGIVGKSVYETQGRNLGGVKEVSVAGKHTKNLRGSLTISNSISSGWVGFDEPEEHAGYFLFVTPAGAAGMPLTGSNRIASIEKTATGFTLLRDRSRHGELSDT